MPPTLTDIPAELSQLIFKSCSQHALHSLSLTCKSLSERVIPHLYRVVDISIHNRPPIIGRHLFHSRELVTDHCPLESSTFKIIRHQHACLNSLSKHPEYATYVEVFKWTLIPTPDIGEPSSDNLLIALFEEVETKIWPVFQTLRNVKTLDLGSLHKSYVRYAAETPSVLFPNATSIRLLGCMSHRLATSILYSVDASKLTHLALDSVQDWDPEPDGRPMCRTRQQAVRRYNLRRGRRTEENHNAEATPPRPMRALLPQLKGKCTTLRSLFLRQAAYDDGQSANIHDRPDEEIYTEWADFASSVVLTLETLVVGYAAKRRACTTAYGPLSP
ncbi:hypothetical protein MMC12_002047 [Toensbergia leucococca]|nr:hypothetical protein [Toensbergia leucococca]